MLVPPLAIPVRRPRCCLRCFTFLGINTPHHLERRTRQQAEQSEWVRNSAKPKARRPASGWRVGRGPHGAGAPWGGTLSDRTRSPGAGRARASFVARPEVGSLVGLAGAALDLLLLGEETLELGVGLADDGR